MNEKYNCNCLEALGPFRLILYNIYRTMSPIVRFSRCWKFIFKRKSIRNLSFIGSKYEMKNNIRVTLQISVRVMASDEGLSEDGTKPWSLVSVSASSLDPTKHWYLLTKELLVKSQASLFITIFSKSFPPKSPRSTPWTLPLFDQGWSHQASCDRKIDCRVNIWDLLWAPEG